MLTGDPISISLQPTLFAHRGRLVSGNSTGGVAVYAAAFLRQRKILLEQALLADPTGFRLILIHELFHFVWLRLGNPARQEFGRILSDEQRMCARGELGESSTVRKQMLEAAPTVTLWREYVCESFCDTAAWLYGEAEVKGLFTLRKRWRDLREAWFAAGSAKGAWRC